MLTTTSTLDRVAEPLSDDVAEPLSDDVAEPLSDDVAEPLSDDVAVPTSNDVADPTTARSVRRARLSDRPPRTRQPSRHWRHRPSPACRSARSDISGQTHACPVSSCQR